MLFESNGLSVIAARHFTLPVSAYGFWRSKRRPPWLATMLLLAGRR